LGMVSDLRLGPGKNRGREEKKKRIKGKKPAALTGSISGKDPSGLEKESTPRQDAGKSRHVWSTYQFCTRFRQKFFERGRSREKQRTEFK